MSDITAKNSYLWYSSCCRAKVTTVDKHVHGSLWRTLHTHGIASLHRKNTPNLQMRQ